MATGTQAPTREARREIATRDASGPAELEMLHAYRRRLLSELAEVDRELAGRA